MTLLYCRTQLAQVFDLIQEVNLLDSNDPINLSLLGRPDLNVTFTKLHCWRLTQFNKCVFLDADTLVSWMSFPRLFKKNYYGQGHSMILQENCVRPITSLFEVRFYNYFWQTTSLCPIPFRGAALVENCFGLIMSISWPDLNVTSSFRINSCPLARS